MEADTQGGLYQYTGGLVLSPEAEDLSVHGGSDGEQSDEQKKSGDEEYNNSVASVALRRAFRQILKPEEQPLERDSPLLDHVSKCGANDPAGTAALLASEEIETMDDLLTITSGDLLTHLQKCGVKAASADRLKRYCERFRTALPAETSQGREAEPTWTMKSMIESQSAEVGVTSHAACSRAMCNRTL